MSMPDSPASWSSTRIRAKVCAWPSTPTSRPALFVDAAHRRKGRREGIGIPAVGEQVHVLAWSLDQSVQLEGGGGR